MLRIIQRDHKFQFWRNVFKLVSLLNKKQIYVGKSMKICLKYQKNVLKDANGALDFSKLQ